MSFSCSGEQPNCFTNLPLFSVLSEWMDKNFQVSHCTTTFLIQLGLALLTWYAVKFALNIFFTLTYPVMMLVCGYMSIQILRMAGSELPEMFQFYFDAFFHWVTSIGLRILGYFCRTFSSGPLLHPSPY